MMKLTIMRIMTDTQIQKHIIILVMTLMTETHLKTHTLE